MLEVALRVHPHRVAHEGCTPKVNVHAAESKANCVPNLVSGPFEYSRCMRFVAKSLIALHQDWNVTKVAGQDAHDQREMQQHDRQIEDWPIRQRFA